MKRALLLLGIVCLSGLSAYEPGSLTYVQASAGLAPVYPDPTPIAGFGCGWRYIWGGGNGIDISGLIMAGPASVFVQLPRVRYLRYLGSRVYIGAGGSLGGYGSIGGGGFEGISAEFVAGMDIFKGRWSSMFCECSVSQPVIGSGTGSPTLIFTIGLGL